jgi:hypothetical protein
LTDADASKYNCGTQESALGGRGIIVTALTILDTATAPKTRMDFNSILFNTMALLLSIYDTDRSEDGISVLALVGLNYLITRLGE